jgi:hypothetical protein
VLQTVDPATLAALKANSANTAAQAKALSELSGAAPAYVGRAVLLSAKCRTELATLAAIDPATLQSNAANKAAGARAVAEIASKFVIPPAAALARL